QGGGGGGGGAGGWGRGRGRRRGRVRLDAGMVRARRPGPRDGGAVPAGAGPAAGADRAEEVLSHRRQLRPTTTRSCRPSPDAMKPGFHCVRTHWIRGFIVFRRVRHARTVMLVVVP